MKFLRSHLHPAALKSLPARGVEAAGRNQEVTNNTRSLGDASVQGSECLGPPPPTPPPAPPKENGQDLGPLRTEEHADGREKVKPVVRPLCPSPSNGALGSTQHPGGASLPHFPCPIVSWVCISVQLGGRGSQFC